MATVRMRWLIAALHQSGSDILDVFSEWRAQRLNRRPELTGGDLRHYYRLRIFRDEFTEFLSCRVSNWPSLTVRAFLDYEKTLADCIAHDDTVPPQADPLPIGSAFSWTDVPARCPQVYVLELSWDLHALIDCLKRQQAPTRDVQRQVFYATRPVGKEATRVVEIGPLSAQILKLSSGTRDLAEVAELFRTSYKSGSGLSPETTCISLIESMAERGFLRISRVHAA